jgi:hypothetical protein
VHARFIEAGDPIIGHIERLPINAAHRSDARDHYKAAEALLGRVATLLARIRLLRAGWRGAYPARNQ